jgi:hypothetical protein
MSTLSLDRPRRLKSMSRSIGNALPGNLTDLLGGHDVALREGLTLLLVTTALDGWPHVAMLSAGEVLATDAREVRLALWPGSGTTANLAHSARSLLMIVAGNASYYVRLAARRGGDLSLSHGPRAFFVAVVEDVLEDVVGYAEITSGIEFRLKEPAAVLAAWTEAVAAMRSAPRLG